MEQTQITNEASNGTSALDDGLERQRFQNLCDLLPTDVNWFDPITPAIMREIVISVEKREREACAKVAEQGEWKLTKTGKRIASAIRMRSNAPHEGPGAALSRTVPLDAVVGRHLE